MLLDISDSSIWLLELFTAGWTSTHPLTVLLVRLLHWEPVWSRSGSESSRLWLSSELESWTARLSVVLLLGELLVGVAAHTGGGCIAVFKGTGFIVSVTTVKAEMVVDCATFVQEAGVGVLVVWLSGVRVAEVEVSSGSGSGGGTGAFLFLCWLSEPRPI